MTTEQIMVSGILVVMIGLFIQDRLRHDFVALSGLLACIFTGLVPAGKAFDGFGHPAVVTVAGVLILSGALQSSGAADALMRAVMPRSAGPRLTLAMLVILAALMSAFMNNVGALALLLPVSLQAAARQNLSPGRLLMPLAFGSILGGMTTLIGTPPNLIVAGFRAQNGIDAFAMFDFTPVGMAVSVAGIVFIVLVGWRLVPERKRAGGTGFDIGSYLTEARVPEKSKTIGKTLIDIGRELGDVDAQILGLIRNDVRIPVPDSRRQIRKGDILVIEADPPSIREILSILDLQLEDDRPADLGPEEKTLECDSTPGADDQARCAARERDVQSDEVTLAEMVIFSHSGLAGRTVTDVRLRTVHRINLLAVSRQGRRTTARLRFLRLAPGDVLLLQGERGALNDFAVHFGCIPLAEREIKLPRKQEAVLAGVVMAAGVGAAAFGWISAAVSFTGAALTCVLLKLIPPRRFYESVDWPVVVLLGALIPVAQAVADTGTAALIGRGLVEGIARGNALFSLVLILLTTITLTSFMSNAATAAVMCPVAISTAQNLAVSFDPFLMAVAVGSSCAFLTPISHQNNTLILGPGGFRFGDYWQLGLPLEILVVGIGIPMILLVWPM